MTDVIVECADVHSETYCSLGVFSTNLVNLVPSPKSNIYDGFFYFYSLIIYAKTHSVILDMALNTQPDGTLQLHNLICRN